MHFAIVAALCSCIAISSAHIVGITGPAKYAPGANSKYPLTFTTIDSPITNEDFSAVIGLATSTTNPDGLGSFVQNFDLQNTGHGSTAHGNFTLEVTLPKSRFFNGPGKYVIKAAVTNADGAEWNVQVLFFTTTVTVTT